MPSLKTTCLTNQLLAWFVLLLLPSLALAQNTPPVADAGPDQVIVTDTTILRGTATDPDGDPIVTWL